MTFHENPMALIIGLIPKYFPKQIQTTETNRMGNVRQMSRKTPKKIISAWLVSVYDDYFVEE